MSHFPGMYKGAASCTWRIQQAKQQNVVIFHVWMRHVANWNDSCVQRHQRLHLSYTLPAPRINVCELVLPDIWMSYVARKCRRCRRYTHMWQAYEWHHWFLCGHTQIWVHMCDITHSCVRHHLFTWETHTKLGPCVWYYSFLCGHTQIWVHMCDMTHSYVRPHVLPPTNVCASHVKHDLLGDTHICGRHTHMWQAYLRHDLLGGTHICGRHTHMWQAYLRHDLLGGAHIQGGEDA